MRNPAEASAEPHQITSRAVSAKYTRDKPSHCFHRVSTMHARRRFASGCRYIALHSSTSSRRRVSRPEFQVQPDSPQSMHRDKQRYGWKTVQSVAGPSRGNGVEFCP